MSKDTLGWIALGIAVLGFIAWIVREILVSDTALSTHGWIAFTLGVIGTSAIAGVLMWLLFQSSRRGYDR
jgi:hypothetical protein